MSDPNIEDCPMVGCSTGFMEMTGYTLNEIVGRNCRFLVDPVPKEYVDQTVRLIARDYCMAVCQGQHFQVPDSHRQPWMPLTHSDDGIFCVQTNSRKSGELFKNLFHLKRIELDDRPYIIGLQSELQSELWDEGREEEAEKFCAAACQTLYANMVAAEKIMAKMFWLSSPMRRQDFATVEEGFTPLAAN
eukprot:CAMPEP_0197653946 /NCGR_PEP_ID=MMETSP1338-20131121/37871_1 /TAXON_ID=43686 ORGANISM="Pelagodinium beii, Strain RCC1491" /NCGR_SAMPLE_ID=MMETSP1338 /ASSEMBLY_ACC=CAM_ASM_000754 /LENGTH=188 /DNA_ID=CAMNT_0043229261 /DNA_START=30 /DNA_END=596 /DNA_ORIENTATION=-